MVGVVLHEDDGNSIQCFLGEQEKPLTDQTVDETSDYAVDIELDQDDE